jgi:hypothetical protein
MLLVLLPYCEGQVHACYETSNWGWADGVGQVLSACVDVCIGGICAAAVLLLLPQCLCLLLSSLTESLSMQLLPCSCCAVVSPSPQGYDACTWESEQCPALMQPEHVQLHLALWDRQHRALARASEEARRKERAAAQAAERNLPVVRLAVDSLNSSCCQSFEWP